MGSWLVRSCKDNVKNAAEVVGWMIDVLRQSKRRQKFIELYGGRVVQVVKADVEVACNKDRC